MIESIDTKEIFESKEPDRPRHDMLFFGFLCAGAYLSRENPSFEYPRILWLLLGLLSAHVALHRLRGRAPGVASLVSVGLNLLLVAFLVDASGGPRSVLWPLFLLPTFTAALSLPSWTLRTAGLETALLGFLCLETLSKEEGAILEFLFKSGLLYLSAWLVSRIALSEKGFRLELRQREDQLRQAQKLEAIGRLAGGVAHDFNNQLMVINGYSDFLLGGLPPDSRLREDVDEIKKAGVRSAALTRQLLAFSRKQTLKPQVVDLNGLLTGQERLLRRLLGEDIEIRLVQDPQLWRVRTDPGQIEQAVMNLAVNARDAMPQGGRLTLRTSNADLDRTALPEEIGLEPGPYVIIAVEDSGFGMDQETRSRVFEPFFTTKPPGKGTGLGLAMVYGTLRQGGGFVTVESEPGRGSTFRLFFPKIAPEAAACEERAPSGPASGAETVLLVEDDDAIRHLARRVLRQNGYEVLEARHGAEGLEIGRRHMAPIHLLLTDLVMPELNGRELARRLTALRPEMQVLYMTGYADADRLDLAGIAEGLLHKPLAPEDLARHVRNSLDKARRAR